MTNDSGLFRSAEELEADGAYPVASGAWERGNTRFLPLMAGRVYPPVRPPLRFRPRR
jgi:hypothetical protein